MLLTVGLARGILTVRLWLHLWSGQLLAACCCSVTRECGSAESSARAPCHNRKRGAEALVGWHPPRQLQLQALCGSPPQQAPAKEVGWRGVKDRVSSCRSDSRNTERACSMIHALPRFRLLPAERGSARVLVGQELCWEVSRAGVSSGSCVGRPLQVDNCVSRAAYYFCCSIVALKKLCRHMLCKLAVALVSTSQISSQGPKQNASWSNPQSGITVLSYVNVVPVDRRELLFLGHRHGQGNL